MSLSDYEKQFIDLRSTLIEREFAALNPDQRRAVMAVEGPVLVLAGAGSGKTTVLINRIYNIIKYGAGSDSEYVPKDITVDDIEFMEARTKDPGLTDPEDRLPRLLAVDPCPPWRILAITFTNKAAAEMRDRLSALLGDRAQDIWASTFHSACVRILRRDITRLGYGQSFTIYDSDDSKRVMGEVLKELNVDDKKFPPKGVLEEIGRAKDNLQTPDAYLEANAADYRKKMIGTAYQRYQKRLREANALDFDDLIMQTVLLLQNNPETRVYYQERFRYVLIDEYQDTNHAQYMLAAQLAGGHGNLCVVGDDDQSIYRFRGATIENILSFEEEHVNTRVIRLEQNYRSTKYILEAANRIIENNYGRKGKNLWTGKEGGEKVCLYTAADEQEEAGYIAETVLAGVAQGQRFSEYTILYRMNAQSNAIEQMFARRGIPYKVFGGLRFYDRAEVKDMLSYLCVISNPGDNLRLARVVNSPPRGIGDKSVGTASEIAVREGTTLFDTLSKATSYQEIGRAAHNMEAFCTMIVNLAAMAEKNPPSMVYEELLEQSGYRNKLLLKNDEESRGRLDNIAELKSSIMDYEKRTQEPTLSGFLEEVALFTDLDRYNQEGDAVTMMTIHSAKGLEFPAVFVCGAEEGIFPSFRSMTSQEDLEEERRLAYVAVTRAKNRLHITNATRRMLFGSTQYNPPSRFIGEIPEDCTERAHMGILSGKPHIQSPANVGRLGMPHSVHSSAGAGKRLETKPVRPQAAEIKAPPAQIYKEGMKVEHKAFGEGVVTYTLSMGGDQLIEVTFTSGDKKKLMAKSAARFMKVLE